MIRMYVRHAVDDFHKWRSAHEAEAAQRKALGVVGEGAHRGLDDPNEVTYWHDFATPEEARAYADAAGDDRASRIVWFAHAL